MRVAILTRAIFIAAWFSFIACDHAPSKDSFSRASVPKNSYCNSLLFGHSDNTNASVDSGSLSPVLRREEPLFFCHRHSSTSYIRCSLSLIKGRNEVNQLVEKFVVREDEFSCKSGTHFSSLRRACVSEKYSNCAARFSPLISASASAHEQTLCNEFDRQLPRDAPIARSRLICHDQTQRDFVVCPVNSAFAERFSCADGMFFNQNMSRCVPSADQSDCPVPKSDGNAEAAFMVDASALRKCICNSVRKENPSRSVLYAGNPDNDRMFLICLKDGRVYSNKCPKGKYWNRLHKCSNIPLRKSYPECERGSSNAVPVVPVGGSTVSGGTAQQRCVCEAALLGVVGDRMLYRCDPHNPSKFLTCTRGSVTVHSCPRGLFWNGKLNGCSAAKSCLPVPPRCAGSNPSPSGPNSHLPQSVAPIQRCICSETMVRSGRDMIHRCDPLNENGYLVCRLGVVERKPCPPGQKWNVLKSSCSHQKKCMPIPRRCRFGAHMTTPPPPTTTTTTRPPVCTTRYTLYEKKLTWHFARLVCEANLSELAVILNNETQALLTKKYGSDKKYGYGGIWIGASDGGEEGKWRWVNGPLVKYSNWYPGQPSGYKYQHCMQFNYYKVKGAWDDTRCYYKKKFLCQKEECTSSIQLP